MNRVSKAEAQWRREAKMLDEIDRLTYALRNTEIECEEWRKKFLEVADERDRLATMVKAIGGFSYRGRNVGG
jgi:hypothetical protein